MELIVLNGVMIIIAGLLSQLVSRFFSSEPIDFVLTMVNIVVLIVGITGAIKTENPVLLLVSIVVGSLLGSVLDIDAKLNQFGKFLEEKIVTKDKNFSKAFITVTMIHCIGSMAILGPINMGLNGDGQILWVKTIIDFMSTLIYGSVYGLGVIGSAGVVILYQGSIFLLASSISPWISSSLLTEISAVGSLLIIALALDLLDIKKIKVTNGLPAILIVILSQWVL